MNGKVYCNGTRIKCLQQMELTVGMVGAEVEFDFSEEWDGLGKLAVFRSDGSRDVIVDENGVAVVPHEILTTPGMDVEVGVYAVREDGTTWPAPTPFCKLTRNGIAEGADPSGDESYPPTPEVGEQAVAMAGAALAAAEEAKAMAEGAVKSVNNVKPDENGNVNVAGGNGGGNEADGAGKAIVDVTELPTENINEAVLYRLTTGMVVFNGQNGRVFDNTAVYIVDSLPETGEPCSSDIGESTAIYYNTSKGAAYGYIDERASVSLMQPVGWKSASTAFAAMGYQYSGVVTSMNDVARSSAAVLLEHALYHYKNGWERVACDTPFFDLSNLGLEAVDLAGVAGGVSVRVGADTRAIINALARGAVKFGFQIIYNGATLDVEALGSAMYLEAENTYQIHNFSVFADMPMTVTISVDELYVSVSVAAAQSGGGSIELDTTLTQSGKAADAKAVGDALDALEAKIGEDGGVSDYTELTNKPKINGVEVSGDKTSADYGIGNPTDEQVATSVEAWLDAHPEATTTVADGSINPDKTTWMHQVWHNIFDKDDAGVEDGYFFFTDANANTTGGGSANYFVSGFIPVVAGRRYYFNAANIHMVKIFDKDKVYISTLSKANIEAGTVVDIPDGAAYMRFCPQKTVLTIDAAQVYEYIGEVWEYDTYKNLCSIVISDAGYSKAVADLVEKKFVDGSLAPAELFADESILYKQMKGWDEFRWNLVDNSDLEVGCLWADGTERPIKDTADGFYRRTKFIPVTPGETLHFLGFGLKLYDSEKNYISDLSAAATGVVVPDGAAFFRACNYYYTGVTPDMSVYRSGYGRNLAYDSVVSYDECIPRFTVTDVLEAYKCYLGIHPWADKNFGIIGDSFTAPGVWDSVMCANLKAASRWNHAISGGRFGDADGVPKTAYEQAQEMVTNGESPDVILITMGVNDANNNTMGEIVESNSISDFDLTTYTGGMQACLNYLQNNFPNAIIYVGWTPAGANCNFSAADTTALYVERMQEVCLMYGVEYIETRTCGITKYSDIYADCWESGVNGGHPSGVGQQKIGAYMTRLMRSKA